MCFAFVPLAFLTAFSKGEQGRGCIPSFLTGARAFDWGGVHYNNQCDTVLYKGGGRSGSNLQRVLKHVESLHLAAPFLQGQSAPR